MQIFSCICHPGRTGPGWFFILYRAEGSGSNCFALAGLNAEGVLPVYEAGRLSLKKLQVLNDNGKDIYYGDTVVAKNLSTYNLKEFISVIIQSPQQEVLR